MNATTTDKSMAASAATDATSTQQSAHDWTGTSHSVFVCNGATGHALRDREEHDYYATDPRAVELLLQLESFAPRILEPACGEGHIAKVLCDHGYAVEATDLIDRGYGTGGVDFLARTDPFDGDVITNPPYRYAQQFVERALSLVPEGNKVAMFLKLTFLEGKARRALFDSTPPPADMGVIVSSKLRHERKVQQERRWCAGLRLVRLAARLARPPGNPLVQLIRCLRKNAREKKSETKQGLATIAQSEKISQDFRNRKTHFSIKNTPLCQNKDKR